MVICWHEGNAVEFYKVNGLFTEEVNMIYACNGSYLGEAQGKVEENLKWIEKEIQLGHRVTKLKKKPGRPISVGDDKIVVLCGRK